MNAPILSPSISRDRAAIAHKLQETALRVASAQRHVKINFIDGTKLELDDIDLSDSQGQVLVLFKSSLNKIYKFPVATIRSVEETLKEEK